ncbi:MAG: MFS transporter [Rhizobiaceae bacterium]|nr:MAG: MFS transporter [Rhizobiaceae bacterium]
MSPRLNVLEQSPPSARSEWKSGWTVVLAAAMGMGLLSVPTYSMGIFMKPLEDEFGWSRSAIAGGHLFGAVSSLVMGPVIGLIIDRAGPRRLALAGSVLVCGMFAMLSLVGPSITSWWLLWAALSTSALLIKPTVWTAGVSSLFSTSRGLALAVALSGTALASTATPALGHYLIESLGWRSAYMALAGIWAALALPLIFLFFDSAHDRQRTGGGDSKAKDHAAVLTGVSPREGLLSLRFAKLATAAFTATLISASYVTTMVPILMASGQSRIAGATIAGVMGMTTVAGRLFSGVFCDRLNANIIAGATLLLPVGACFLLLTADGSLAAATTAAVAMGLTLGAKLHFIAYLTTKHFGMRSFGVLFGTISGLFGLASGIGPVALNYCYDVTGSYQIALLGTIPLALGASVLFFRLGRYPVFEPAVSSPELTHLAHVARG